MGVFFGVNTWYYFTSDFVTGNMPVRYGKTSRLFSDPHYSLERSEIDIDIHEYFLTPMFGCFAEHKEWTYLIIPFTVIGCASPDGYNCRIHVMKNKPISLEHEIRHCEGWVHPMENPR